MLTPAEYFEAIRRDGDRLAEVAAGAWDRPVPPCPDWKVADLVLHTGEVHRDKIQIIDAGGTTRPERNVGLPAVRDEATVLAWYREGLDLLLKRLDTDPETPAWSWADDHRVAFWQRRMAHETAVHRWDGEAAVGHTTPISPAALADDGIDEVLSWVVLQDPYTGPAGTIHVHSDTGGEWVVRLAPGSPGSGVTVERAHEKADAALRGNPSDLDLVLWGHRSVDAVEVIGDPEMLAAFQAFADLS